MDSALPPLAPLKRAAERSHDSSGGLREGGGRPAGQSPRLAPLPSLPALPRLRAPHGPVPLGSYVSDTPVAAEQQAGEECRKRQVGCVTKWGSSCGELRLGGGGFTAMWCSSLLLAVDIVYLISERCKESDRACSWLLPSMACAARTAGPKAYPSVCDTAMPCSAASMWMRRRRLRSGDGAGGNRGMSGRRLAEVGACWGRSCRRQCVQVLPVSVSSAGRRPASRCAACSHMPQPEMAISTPAL